MAISNFMDDTDDACTCEFRAGQDSGMGDAWGLYRAGNWSLFALNARQFEGIADVTPVRFPLPC
jgi:hypothetical protein